MAEAETSLAERDPDALAVRIERTREELARTIDAIADRVSPKKNVSRVMDQVRQRAGQIDPLVAGAGAAVVVVSVTALFLVRRRRR